MKFLRNLGYAAALAVSGCAAMNADYDFGIGTEPTPLKIVERSRVETSTGTYKVFPDGSMTLAKTVKIPSDLERAVDASASLSKKDQRELEEAGLIFSNSSEGILCVSNYSSKNNICK